MKVTLTAGQLLARVRKKNHEGQVDVGKRFPPRQKKVKKKQGESERHFSKRVAANDARYASYLEQGRIPVHAGNMDEIATAYRFDDEERKMLSEIVASPVGKIVDITASHVDLNSYLVHQLMLRSPAERVAIFKAVAILEAAAKKAAKK